MISRFASGGPWEEIFGYSRTVAAGPLVLSAGCTATVDGGVVHVGDAHGQALVAFRIALEGLTRAGATVSDVVRTRMYVVSADDADAVGRAHAEVFGDVRPVATMVVVARLIHPDHLVEVEVEAYVSAD
jgi:enamine deaminase RidA (YjgF/YER057c/UK114 family)